MGPRRRKSESPAPPGPLPEKAAPGWWPWGPSAAGDQPRVWLLPLPRPLLEASFFFTAVEAYLKRPLGMTLVPRAGPKI